MLKTHKIKTGAWTFVCNDHLHMRSQTDILYNSAFMRNIKIEYAYFLCLRPSLLSLKCVYFEFCKCLVYSYQEIILITIIQFQLLLSSCIWSVLHVHMWSMYVPIKICLRQPKPFSKHFHRSQFFKKKNPEVCYMLIL